VNAIVEALCHSLRGRWRETALVIARAANPEPAMKRINGPKLRTALAPTKCKPVMLDSNVLANRGDPSMHWILARSPGAMMPSFEMST
jgi:hypothetical protein